MQQINIKALIETIRDCEATGGLLDLFPDLPDGLVNAIKRIYPEQIGDGLISFIDEVLPATAYQPFEKFFNSLYATKVYPFWMDTFFQSDDTALRATVAKFGIFPDTVFTSQSDFDRAVNNLAVAKISFKIDWLIQDDRYPDHVTGRLIIRYTDIKLSEIAITGEISNEIGLKDYEFITDIDSLKNYDIEYLEISGVMQLDGNIERCEDHHATSWTLYGRFMEGDLLLPVAIADCSTRVKAQSLQYLLEVLVSQWKGPRHTHYSLLP